MSMDKHDDDCPGCRPALVNPETGKKLPDDSPEMKLVMKVWGQTTKEQREAFHNVTCLNSRTPADMAGMTEITQAIEREFAKPVLH